jgi:hypothetical protein
MAETTRATEIEKLKRLKTVAGWLVEGHTQGEILYNIVTKWGLSESQAYNYISEVKKSWKEDLKGDIQAFRDLAIKRNLDSLTKLRKEVNSVYANTNLDTYKRIQMIGILENRLSAIRQDIAKLQGLYVEKIEHGGNVGGALLLKSVNDMNDEQIAQEIERLHRLREEDAAADEGETEEESG